MATDFTIRDLGSDRFRVSGSIPGYGKSHGKKSDQVRKIVQGSAEAEKVKADLQAQRNVGLMKREGVARGQTVQTTLSRDELGSAEAAVRLIRDRADPRTLLQLVEIGLQTSPMKQRPLDAKLIEEFLAAKKADGISDVSYSSLRAAVRAFVRDCGPAPTAEMVAEWISQPESVDGRKNRRANAGNFLAWCVKNRHFPANHAYDVPRPKRDADEDITPVVLSPKQCRELLKAAKKCGNEVTGYLALSMFAGLRPREIHRLSAEKILGYLKSGEIPVRGKVRSSSGERKSRLVPVEEALRRVTKGIDWTKQYLDCGTDGPGYDRLRMVRMAADAENLGPNKWDPDCLRHCYVSYRLARGGPEDTRENVAKNSGHSEATQAKYYHHPSSKREAVDFWSIAA